MTTTGRMAIDTPALSVADVHHGLEPAIDDSLAAEPAAKSAPPEPAAVPTSDPPPTLNERLAARYVTRSDLAQLRPMLTDEDFDVVCREAVQQDMQRENAKILAAIPEWSNPEVRQQDTNEMRAFAIENGFTEQQLNEVEDARAVKILYKAWRKEQQRTAPDPTPPVRETARAPAPRRGAAELKQLSKSGKVMDAKRAIEALT